MNPSATGWVNKYFSIVPKEEMLKGMLPELMGESGNGLYYLMQPTGMLYGYPTSLLFLEDNPASELTTTELFKVLLLEGLVLTDVIAHGAQDEFDPTAFQERVVDFYMRSMSPKRKMLPLLWRRESTAQRLEKIIDSRAGIYNLKAKQVWKSFLYNSLLFSDLTSYYEYLQGKDPRSLRMDQKEVSLNALRILACALHTDEQVTPQEEQLYDLFLDSAGLNRWARKEALQWKKSSPGLDSINHDVIHSWAMRRYLLDLAVLAVWVDNDLDTSEQLFVEEVAKTLGLDEDQMEESLALIESFVFQYRHNIPYLQRRTGVEHMVTSLTGRWSKVLVRNKKKLSKEIGESQELVRLIKESRRRELTEEEKHKVKEQSMDLLKTVPSLAVFMLPGGAVLLPVLLKLIPDLVPTAFRENEVSPEDPVSQDTEA